jgi:alpha-glucosidase
MHEARDPEWWRDAVIYHVYPRSFQDSDGDGVGDLRGLLRRLDYLNDGTPGSLGVDAVWLSPMFPSPMRDFGYDVSDYCDIDPLFGDLTDFDAVLEACHQRGVRVLLDFVVNHTSDCHPWFLEARSSRSAAKRDWYIWRDPAAGGGPPDAMQAVFGGSAWQLDPASGQYYLHTFLREQPDLNWEHPDVVTAMSDVLRFWMRRGVDGFRLDAVPKLVKHFGQAVAESTADPLDASRSLAGTGRIDRAVLRPLDTIRRVAEEFPDRLLIAEAYAPASELATLYGDGTLCGVHLAFNFQFIRVTSKSALTPWCAPRIAEILGEAAASLPPDALVSYAFSNHDVSRFRSRHDDDGNGGARARAAALLQLGLRGVPCIYYGDELGMVDAAIPASAALDPAGRDASRTPMRWDSTPGHGFSAGRPWLPVDARTTDAQAQDADEGSQFSLYRRALWARKAEPALRGGQQQTLYMDDDLLAVLRTVDGARPVLVALNTANRRRMLPLPVEFAHVLVASDSRAIVRWQGEACTLELPPLAAAWVVP